MMYVCMYSILQDGCKIHIIILTISIASAALALIIPTVSIGSSRTDWTRWVNLCKCKGPQYMSAQSYEVQGFPRRPQRRDSITVKIWGRVQNKRANEHSGFHTGKDSQAFRCIMKHGLATLWEQAVGLRSGRRRTRRISPQGFRHCADAHGFEPRVNAATQLHSCSPC